MSIFYDDDVIKKLHIELTNACNSKCPLCVRTNSPAVEKIKHLTLDDIKKINFENLHHILLCGNFGDPILCPEIYEICDYIIQKGICLHIKTNGGMRDKKFWYDFGKLFSRKNIKERGLPYPDERVGKWNYHKVTFDIDGLEDTNHIYRIGTDFKKIKENAQSFIDGGGLAGWEWLVFKHNQHQIMEARDLAIRMGFYNFSIKKTRSRGRMKKAMKEGHDLNIKNITEKVIDIRGNMYNLDRWIRDDEEIPVKCKGSDRKQIFISCEGDMFPCCWWGGAYTNDEFNIKKSMVPSLINFDNNIRTNTWDNIIKKYSSKKDEMKTNFENRCIEECNEACGKKRTSSVTSLIHLYKRDGKPRNKQRRKFALYGFTQ